jgi:hypothetical protein
MTAFYGKYRGTVVDNVDPEELGRLAVSVPQILGTAVAAWAMPSVPYAGPFVGFYMLPPIDANVWVEFEAGNINYPIWTGCFWNPGELPAEPAVPTTKILKTSSITVKLDDLDAEGGVTLIIMPPAVSEPISVKASSTGVALMVGETRVQITPEVIEMLLQPAAVSVGAAGVSLAHGAATVSLEDFTVSINEGAIEVT